MEFFDRSFTYDQAFAMGQLHLPSADIIQIAELSLIPEGEILEHIQPCDEITYVVSGKATVYSNGKPCVMTPKQVHFIKKGCTHRIVADKGTNFHFCCIGFFPNHAFSGFSEFYDMTKNLSHFVIKDDGTMFSHINTIVGESLRRTSGTELMIHCAFCQAVISMQRIIRSPVNRQNPTRLSESGKAVYQTIKYIDANYLTIERVKDIAGALSYSEYYLSHSFKEKTGGSIKAYLMQKKITTAVQLLRDSNMSIAEIAEHLHFSSVHAFDITFRQYTDTTPTAIRRGVK